MNLRRTIAALAFLSAPMVACQWLVGIGDDNFVVTAPPEAAMPTDAADAEPPDLCPHAVPPGPPDRSDSDEERAFQFAMRSVNVTGRDDGGDAIGFDLDGVCACDSRDPRGASASCIAPAEGTNACDHDAGIDNALAVVFDTVTQVNGDLAATFERQIDCGRQSILFLLAKYNGQANDPDVVAGLVESHGIREPHDGGERADVTRCFPDGLPEAGIEAYPAKHDGTDRWTTPSNTVRTTTAGPVTSNASTGYVKDFQLVLDGRKPGQESRLPVVFGGSVMSISTFVLSVKLVPVDANGNDIPVDGAGRIQSPNGRAAGFRMANGLLTGRAATSDVLTAVGSLIIDRVALGEEELLCHSTFYPIVKQLVCAAADVVVIPTRDFKSDPCNALSIVLHFDAVAAGLGKTYDSPERDAGCSRDSCDEGSP